MLWLQLLLKMYSKTIAILQLMLYTPLKIALLILTASLCACLSINIDKIDINETDFSVIEPNQMYFNNVRSVYYDKDTKSKAPLVLYRITRREKRQDVPVLNLAIVANNANATANIVVEPNAYFSDSRSISINWHNPDNKQQGTYEFDGSSLSNHYQFASQVYISQKKGHTLTYIQNGKTDTIFYEGIGLVPYLRTMRDYFELTGVY